MRAEDDHFCTRAAPIEIANVTTNEVYQIDLSAAQSSDIDFFDRIRPLLQGEWIFKKFSTSSSLNQKPFDPIRQGNPEQHGFGKRLLKLSANKGDPALLSRLDFIRGGAKPISEGSIALDTLMKVVYPTVTQDIVKYQRAPAAACSHKKVESKLPQGVREEQ